MFFITFVLRLLMPMIGGAMIGAIFIGMALFGFWKLRQIQNWQITTGNVTNAWITEQLVKTRRVYQLKVTYEYIVNHKLYQSRRVFIGDRWSVDDRPTVEQQLRYYQPGTQVKVHYNANRPEDAVLELKTHPALYWLLGGGCLFLGMSIFLSAAILPSAMQTCGLTPTSTHATAGAPSWCQE